MKSLNLFKPKKYVKRIEMNGTIISSEFITYEEAFKQLVKDIDNITHEYSKSKFTEIEYHKLSINDGEIEYYF